MGGVRAARRGLTAAARTVARVARSAVRAVGRGAVRLARAVARSPIGRMVARAGRAFMRTRLGKALGRYVRSGRDWFRRQVQRLRDVRERRRERRRKRHEDRRADDMARARRALPPAIHGLLASGVSEWLLKARLAFWRRFYHLRLLAIRRSGQYESVVAANSPEEDLVSGIISASSDVLIHQLHELEESVMTDTEVVRLANEILEQRREKGRGTEQKPILGAAGYGGAASAVEAREQAILGLGAPGTRQVVPGHPMITARNVTKGQRYPQEEFIQVVPHLPGTEVREVAASSLHPGNIVVADLGRYEAIRANPPGNPREFMRGVFAMQRGEQPPTALSPVELIHAARLARLSQVESARGGLVSENLGNLLAGREQLPFQERYGPEQPIVEKGGARYRGSRRLLGMAPAPGLGTSESSAADVRTFLQRELKLVERFVLYEMLTQKELFENEEKLTRYVRRHLIDHLRGTLFAAARSGGAR
jgi:hypothetical protein